MECVITIIGKQKKQFICITIKVDTIEERFEGLCRTHPHNSPTCRLLLVLVLIQSNNDKLIFKVLSMLIALTVASEIPVKIVHARIFIGVSKPWQQR